MLCTEIYLNQIWRNIVNTVGTLNIYRELTNSISKAFSCAESSGSGILTSWSAFGHCNGGEGIPDQIESIFCWDFPSVDYVQKSNIIRS